MSNECKNEDINRAAIERLAEKLNGMDCITKKDFFDAMHALNTDEVEDWLNE